MTEIIALLQLYHLCCKTQSEAENKNTKQKKGPEHQHRAQPCEQSEEQAESKAAQEFPQQLLWQQGRDVSPCWSDICWGCAGRQLLTQGTDSTGPWPTALPPVLLPSSGMDTILSIHIGDNLLIPAYVNITTHGLPSQKISWIKGNLIVLVIFRQMQLVKQNHLQQSAPKGFSVY